MTDTINFTVKNRNYYIISLTLLFILNISILIDHIVFNLPFLRQVSGFIFLSFFPGFTILKLINIKKLNKTVVFLLSIGLSIFYLMIIGLISNILFFSSIYFKPFSLITLITLIDISFISLLILLAYKRNTILQNETSCRFDFRSLLNNESLSLSLLPIFALLFAVLFNYTGEPILTSLTFILTSILFFILAIKKNVKNYIWAIWIFSISLILTTDFSISLDYIWGWDINYEYFISNLVVENGFWDYTISSNVNSMLSIISLNPMYSIILDISGINVFKIIYPIIYSFLPISLFLIYKTFLSEKKSFIAVFFFMSISQFYFQNLQSIRMTIALFFLSLLILLITTKELHIYQKRILGIIFGFSLIVSHYGTSWLFLASLLISIILNILINLIEIKKFHESLKLRFNFKQLKKIFKENNLILRYNFIIIFIIILLSWYTFTANSSPLITIINIGENIINSIGNLFSESAQGYYIISKQYSLFGNITKFLSLTAQFFIMIGVANILINFKKLRKYKEFFLLAIAWFSFDVAGIAVPFFASSLNTLRLYFITLIFLSPVLIIGFESFTDILPALKDGVSNVLTKLFRLKRRGFKPNQFPLKILKNVTKINIKKTVVTFLIIIFLMTHFIFNSGIVHQLSDEGFNRPYLEKNTPYPKWTISERFSSKFIEEYKNEKPIYGDQNSILLFLGTYGQPLSPNRLQSNSPSNFSGEKIQQGSYLFTNSWVNTNQKIEISLPRQEYIYFNLTHPKIFNLFSKTNNIYTFENSNYYIITN